MSLKSRARRLQHATGMTYQQALAKLRALGDRPAELRRATGWPLTKCDLHLCGAGIEVIELEPDPLTALCQQLRAACDALAVWLFGPEGPIVAHAGRRPDLDLGWLWPFRLRAGWPREERALDLGDRRSLLTPLESGGLLVVSFDQRTSLGLVRLRVQKVVPALERLLRRRERTPFVPPGGRGGPGGLPAEVRVTSDIPRDRSSARKKGPAKARRRSG